MRYRLSVEDFKEIENEVGYHLSYRTSPPLGHLFWAVGLGTGATDDIVTTGIPIIYGLLHFLGWHAQFPTTTEQKLWRLATVLVMSSGAVITALFVVYDIANKVWRSVEQKRILQASYDIVLHRIISLFYTLGSAYLLVESIRQLGYLPPEA